MEKITSYLIKSTTDNSEVRAWEEDIMLPTYAIGKEEKNPIFLEKRVYQGSCGSVYPYPVVESISDEKIDKRYRALFIENEYIKVMILPELGGRIHMAYDKVKQRHFVYYNQVVKPALVGLTGPWISGGIEFNWPQHHRPSTFLPTEYSIEEHSDGSKTVWCNEVERMFRTKGMQGFRLYPGKSYIEINVKIYNRTPFPQTFLCWANPAVVVNDHYHSVFPPDVNAVFDHGKRDVSSFPIATGVYYKQDYSAGVDISRYKNIPVPTSYMAIKSKFDFVGGYEEHIGGGLLHVADHHVSPGKKQWTWGNGDFGQAWDRNLTDEDGPYIELMTGMYTDNQPDFSWLQPYEEKSWTQYFLPYSEVGYVKNATKEALLNVDVIDGNCSIKLYTTGVYDNIHIWAKDVKNGNTMLDKVIASAPNKPFNTTIPAPGITPDEIIVEIRDLSGRILVSYQAEKPQIKPIPEPAKAAKDPKDIASIEQLYLTGLHLEQYRHATYNPMDYYGEALQREPGDVRCNNAMGLLYLRKGRFDKAEKYFSKAIETLTERNPNPYDGEPYYNMGWSCLMQDKINEAYEAFFKSAWNAAWQDSAYFELARIDCRRGNFEKALDLVNRSLVRNWHHHKARQLKASILRTIGRNDEALSLINESLKIDRFNIGCLYERFLLSDEQSEWNSITSLLGDKAHAYIEYALDFAMAGFYDEAIDLLCKSTSVTNNIYPMVHYAIGYFYSCKGNIYKASEYYRIAGEADHSYCFPNRIEEVIILRNVMATNDDCAKAAYSLGNFWYASRQYDLAIDCWEKSVNIDPTFPTAWRNLSLAYYNKAGNATKALDALEKAYMLDTTDSRILMELDQLYKRIGRPHSERLSFLESHIDEVAQRDDLSIERITLYNQLGQYAKAKQLIDSRKFHPWEGGEGKITQQYTTCRIELGKIALSEGDFATALQLLNETDAYPHNLGEGKLINAEENDIWYYKGLALRGLGREDEAVEQFTKGTTGSSEPQQAFFYNDAQPDKIFYQGLSWRELGREDKARSCFNKLIKHGEKHLFDDCRIDYFAVSLPDLAIWEDDLNKRNKIHCYYVMGLGYLGLDNKEEASKYLKLALALDSNHQGVLTHLALC